MPLPEDVRRDAERILGEDLSDVRIHVGPEPRRLRALAFTMGPHVYFAPGLYDPRTREGRTLLGHELAHVVQQRRGHAKNRFGYGIAVVRDPVLEDEAVRVGGLLASTVVQPSAPHPAKVAQRKPTIRLPAVAQRSSHGDEKMSSNVFSLGPVVDMRAAPRRFLDLPGVEPGLETHVRTDSATYDAQLCTVDGYNTYAVISGPRENLWIHVNKSLRSPRDYNGDYKPAFPEVGALIAAYFGGTMTLYRGVAASHPVFDAARQGRLPPKPTADREVPEFTSEQSTTEFIPFSTDRNVALMALKSGLMNTDTYGIADGCRSRPACLITRKT